MILLPLHSKTDLTLYSKTFISDGQSKTIISPLIGSHAVSYLYVSSDYYILIYNNLARFLFYSCHRLIVTDKPFFMTINLVIFYEYSAI